MRGRRPFHCAPRRPGWGAWQALVTLADGVPGAEISVQDTGIGLDPEHHELVFEKFYQADNQKSASAKGTGLGLAIAKEMDVEPALLPQIARAAFLHDIGKMAIPDLILRKPGPLTPEERNIMRTHCEIGYNMVKRIPFLREAAEIVLSHQEYFDGSGYPNGLHGEDIPIVARIVAVADVFDALVSERPYKHAWTLDEGFEYLQAQKGKHFDPRCVEAFMSAGEKMREIQREFADN